MTARSRKGERGAGLIIVILVAVSLSALGLTLMVLTSMGPKMSGMLRFRQEAFNAAEAGFEAARTEVEDRFAAKEWQSFAGHTLTEPSNIDRPLIGEAINPGYFRRKTDADILASFDPNGDGEADVSPLVFFHRTFALGEGGTIDPRLAYTAFLIDDEANVGAADANDALLVVIGEVRAGSRILATTRLEIVLAYGAQGTGE